MRTPSCRSPQNRRELTDHRRSAGGRQSPSATLIDPVRRGVIGVNGIAVVTAENRADMADQR